MKESVDKTNEESLISYTKIFPYVNVGRDVSPNKEQMEFPKNKLLRNESTKTLSMNVVICALSLKVWLGETLQSFQKNKISYGDDVIDDVYNIYNHQKVPDEKRGEFLNSLIADNDRNLTISSNSSRNLKDNLPTNKHKHNASLTLYHETNTKKFDNFWSIKNQNIFMNMN